MNEQLRKFDRKFILLLIITLFWMALIFFFSSQPADDSARESGKIAQGLLVVFKNLYNNHPPAFITDIVLKGDHFVRKSGHFIEYFIFGSLMISLIRRLKPLRLFQPLRPNQPLRPHRPFLLSLLICFLYAASDEFHQLFVPGRAGMISDVLLDTAAAFVGILIAYLLIRRH